MRCYCTNNVLFGSIHFTGCLPPFCSVRSGRSLQNFDGSKHRARNLTIPYAPFLLRSGDATAEGSPGVAFDSATLTGVALPPHTMPLVMDHDGGGIPGQSERFESFEVVSAPSISAVNGGGNDSDNAHTWWTNLLDLIAVHSVEN